MKAVLKSDEYIQCSRDQIATRLEHEVVILNTYSGRYYTLSGVGVAVWELLQTPQTSHTLHEAILKGYNVSAEQASQDLTTLLGDLYHAGLITQQ